VFSDASIRQAPTPTSCQRRSPGLAHLRIQAASTWTAGWRDRDQIKLILPGGNSAIRHCRPQRSQARPHEPVQPEGEDRGHRHHQANGRIDDLKIEIAGSVMPISARSRPQRRCHPCRRRSADIAPTQSAKIKIAGPSTVNLHSDPKDLTPRSPARQLTNWPQRLRHEPGDHHAHKLVTIAASALPPRGLHGCRRRHRRPEPATASTALFDNRPRCQR
jgi:hypothetical protein